MCCHHMYRILLSFGYQISLPIISMQTLPARNARLDLFSWNIMLAIDIFPILQTLEFEIYFFQKYNFNPTSTVAIFISKMM